VRMLRHLRSYKRMRRFTGGFSLRVPVSDVNWHSSLKVRELEGRCTISSVHCAQQRKERLILVDRKCLPIAKRPASRWKIKAESPDFSNEWF